MLCVLGTHQRVHIHSLTKALIHGSLHRHHVAHYGAVGRVRQSSALRRSKVISPTTQVIQTAGRAADPLAAYRPAAVALGAALIAGAVSNALLSTLTAWTAERFGARLKSKLFEKILSNDQARAGAWFLLSAVIWPSFDADSLQSTWNPET